jgi:glycosyltransferase involved in cell wall biosynthesis
VTSGNSSSLDPLRIGMLVGAYAPDPEGGAERQCRLLAQTLTARGCTVGVITFRHSRHTLRTSDDGGVSVYRLSILGFAARKLLRALESRMLRAAPLSDPASMGPVDRRARAFSFWLALPMVWLARLGFLLELRWLIKRNPTPFDVLHVHESGWLAGVGVMLGQFWHIPVVCLEATAPALGPIGYDTPFRRLWNRRRRSANAWLAQTSTIRDELLALRITPGRIHLLPNGVVLPPETASPGYATDVLYVGNLTQGSAWKAFDVLFDAWVRIAQARPDARLIVVGGGDPKTWIRVLQGQGVKDTVDFRGRVDDPSSFYREAGLFVLPSRVEGMSNALLEAMSWGLPCVVSNIPGNRAVIDNEVNGLVIPVNNAAAFAEAIIRLLSNPTLRSSMGSHARQKAESEYDIQHVTDRLIEIYRGVLAEHIGAAKE